MEDKEIKESQDAEQAQPEKEYPPKKIVLPAMAAIWLAVFLVALDRTIIGTAIPTITNEFNSFGDVAWYEAGFLLPLCVLQLTFGLVYRHYPAKWIICTLVFIFEIGSILCAAAPNSDALIVGRVIAGIGAGGINSGAFLLISILVPLESRPKCSGALGSVFGISSIIGPIIGGAFTQHVSWRWCFWINVPIGGVSLLLLLFLTPKRAPPIKAADTWLGKIKQLDPLGFILLAPAVICVLFALQWGGTTYAWNDWRIILLFVLFGVLGAAFVASQAYRKDKATVPPRIFLQRSILVGCLASFGIGSVLVTLAFYLPIWFQVIKGKSPEASGMALIPLLLSVVVAVITGGISTSIFGYYTPFFITGGALLSVGTGLISTWSVNVNSAHWIPFQVIAGLGLGLVLQQPIIAAQTVLPDDQVSIGLSLLTFVNFLGGSIFVTVSQTLLQNQLSSGLSAVLPNFDASALTSGGATSYRNSIPKDILPTVLRIYNNSIRSIWYLTLALSCWIFVVSLGMEWRSVKKDKQKMKAVDAEVQLEKRAPSSELSPT